MTFKCQLLVTKITYLEVNIGSIISYIPDSNERILGYYNLFCSLRVLTRFQVAEELISIVRALYTERHLEYLLQKCYITASPFMNIWPQQFFSRYLEETRILVVIYVTSVLTVPTVKFRIMTDIKLSLHKKTLLARGITLPWMRWRKYIEASTV